jgi:hypothetical protein
VEKMKNNNLVFDKNIKFLSYDLRSENIKNLTNEQKGEIAKIRTKIYYTIKYKYRMRIINESLYLIPEKTNLEVLKMDIEKWNNEYQKFNLTPLIRIIEIMTNQEGYQTFKELEKSFLLEWLSGINETLDKHIKDNHITKNKFNQISKKIQLISDIINEDFKGDIELNDYLLIAYDKLNNIQIKE